MFFRFLFYIFAFNEFILISFVFLTINSPLRFRFILKFFFHIFYFYSLFTCFYLSIVVYLYHLKERQAILYV